MNYQLLKFEKMDNVQIVKFKKYDIVFIYMQKFIEQENIFFLNIVEIWIELILC